MDINGRIAVVAGGASGLGRACVARLLALGARVGVIDADMTAFQEIETSGARCWHGDVSDADAIERVFAEIAEGLGTVSILFNSAGVACPGSILRGGVPMPLEEFRQVISVNLLGTINTIRCAVPQMISAAEAGENPGGESGVIINTGSIAGFEGQVGQAAYSASKGGVAAITLPLARELGRFGIRVNAVAPGVFATPMTLSLPPKSREVVFAAVPPFPPRPGSPEEFADMLAYIVTQPMLNGAVIRLDGALRMPALY